MGVYVCVCESIYNNNEIYIILTSTAKRSNMACILYTSTVMSDSSLFFLYCLHLNSMDNDIPNVFI